MSAKKEIVKAADKPEGKADSGSLHGEIIGGKIVITKGDENVLSIGKTDALSAARLLLALGR